MCTLVLQLLRQLAFSTFCKAVSWMLLPQVYGGLPPEARTAQAVLFNTPRTGRNVLVASDAIGMGLNLGIRCAGALLFLLPYSSLAQQCLQHSQQAYIRVPA